MSATAVDFFDSREREVYQNYRMVSSEFFQEAAEEYDTPYWTLRAESARTAGGGAEERPPGPAPDQAPGRPPDIADEDVRAAFERIRDMERFGAVASPSLRVVDRAAIESHRIVQDRHLASDAYPHGIRFYRDVDLRRIVDEAPGHSEVPELWKAYNQKGTPANLPDFLAGLAAAFAAGFLQHPSDIQ